MLASLLPSPCRGLRFKLTFDRRRDGRPFSLSCQGRTLRAFCALGAAEPKHWSAGLRHGVFQNRRSTMPCRRPALQPMSRGRVKAIVSHFGGSGEQYERYLGGSGSAWWGEATDEPRIAAWPPRGITPAREDARPTDYVELHITGGMLSTQKCGVGRRQG